MKKRFCTSFMIIALVFTAAFAFVGCNGNVSKNDIYDKVAAVIEKIDNDKDDVGMFISDTTNGVKSDYCNKIYHNHSSLAYYDELFVLPANYLKNYYKDLERLKLGDVVVNAQGQQAINNLATSINQLLQGYNASVENYKTYTNLASDSGYSSSVVVQGALTIYNLSLKDMTMGAYNSAIALSQVKDYVLNDFAGLKQTNTMLQQKDSETLRDYISLKIAVDYYNAMIVNLDMNDYSSSSSTGGAIEFATFFKSLKQGIKNLYNFQAIEQTNLKVLTGTPITEDTGNGNKVIGYKNTAVEEILSIVQLLNNEEVMLNQAFSSFNMLSYCENYDFDIENYSKVTANAEEHLAEIELFFEHYVQNLITYFSQALTQE